MANGKSLVVSGKIKNSTHKGMKFLGIGNGAWGRSYQCPMPNAQCPKRRGDYPSTDTWGWSFPSLSINHN
ncbi:hypothetical protein HUN01_23215 [Nostoc edaphicum CCNP1411]|uniref:Uncharacterized protein n=1 Tax=Nostoc edaphicum CCNP1411 TaxID=1472755 RepID=A0A7D7LH80_9NOSO|nr:hypothetical protein [Nostoc edaphicum]QMS90349.1 hypothetical protein HUN01_23215 [Nostoc edaphicum CCNP1411]